LYDIKQIKETVLPLYKVWLDLTWSTAAKYGALTMIRT